VREAEAQVRYRELLAGDAAFEVPSVVHELSTRRVLVTTWLRGQPIDKAMGAGLSQEHRNDVARQLLKLTLRELFEWRFMQTDPNWGNFFYDAERRVVGLLDFGATRDFPKAFVDDYLRLVWAAANGDRETIREVSLRVGFLTGHESKAMLNAHIESGLVVGEPFTGAGGVPFDFKASGITTRVGAHGAVFAEERLTAPPNEVYSLHRKLAGAFLICIRMGAKIHCRDLLEDVWRNYKWG
jgi:aarF domain-containing kinase